MKLISLADNVLVQNIPEISIAFMMKNTPELFSPGTTPPADERLLNDRGESRSFEVVVGTRYSLPNEYEWREATLREALWLLISHLKFERFSLKERFVRTATDYPSPCVNHFSTQIPIVLLELKNGKIHFKPEYPSALNDDLGCFWLKPRQ